MKKYIVSMLFAWLGFAAYSYAQDVMVVEKKDKTTVKYNVDDVQRVYFEVKQGEPSFTFTPSTETGGASSTGVSNLTQTGVTISAKVTITNTTDSYYCGIAIDKTSSVTATNNIDKKTSLYSGNGTKTVSYSFSGLSSSTTYYYVVYILYGGKYYYSARKSFTTASTPTPTPSFTATTKDATGIGQTTATLNGTFNVQNATSSYKVGFFISTSSTPTSSNALKDFASTLTSTNYSGDRTASATGLTANTKYYFRAYILSDGKYYYGTTKSFTTSSPAVSCTATTSAATDITETTAKLHGSFVVKNATKSYTVGFLLSTNSTPTSANALKNLTKSLSDANYESDLYGNVTGLTANTKYYFRAYILYDGKYTYGSTLSFTTETAPFSYSIHTKEATNVGQTTARLNAHFKVNNAPQKYTIGFICSTSSTVNMESESLLFQTYHEVTDVNYDKDDYFDITDKDNLQSNMTYYYRAYLWIGTNKYYGDIKTFTTKGTATTGTLNGHAWVDLGLPDGTKWATCNVGASTPEGYGDYYAWGETATKSTYSPSTWLYYNVNLGADIAGTQYDVAHVKWGSTWKMPSNAQVMTLINNCSHVWTTLNGVKGMKFTGPNGNSIFLPAAGIKGMGPLDVPYYSEVGTDGYYWQSTDDELSNGNTWLHFVSSQVSGLAGSGGEKGCTIRPVTK